MIKLHQVDKSFGSLKVLKEVTLHVKEKEVVCIIGPSGSGKSTLLRCINLLENVQAGHVIVDGYDLTDPKTDINQVRTEVGMVFQHFNLFPHKKVIENITLAPIKVRKWPKEKAEQKALELLNKVGLSDKAYVYPDSLSGGQNSVLRLPEL